LPFQFLQRVKSIASEVFKVSAEAMFGWPLAANRISVKTGLLIIFRAT
jgi:hypothetical protein